MEPTTDSNATPNANTLTPGELADEAALLADRRDRLESVRNAIAKADRARQVAWTEAQWAFSEAMTEAESDHVAITEPLIVEAKGLASDVARSEAAAAELEARRSRAAKLRAQLAAAESDLPSED